MLNMLGTIRIIKKQLSLMERDGEEVKYLRLLIVDATNKDAKPIGCYTMKPRIVKFLTSKYEAKDENGKPLMDDNGKPVKRDAVTAKTLLSAVFHVTGAEYDGKITAPSITLVDVQPVAYKKKEDGDKDASGGKKPASKPKKKEEEDDMLLEPDDTSGFETLGDGSDAEAIFDILNSAD